jgi:metal-sulfur cluster biosynthetic enzyme
MNSRLIVSAVEALRTVVDPEIGYNIVDLGLIYDIWVKDGVASICMTTTRPGVFPPNSLRESVETALTAVNGITAVAVEMTWIPPWSPSLMSGRAKAAGLLIG